MSVGSDNMLKTILSVQTRLDDSQDTTHTGNTEPLYDFLNKQEAACINEYSYHNNGENVSLKEE